MNPLHLAKFSTSIQRSFAHGKMYNRSLPWGTTALLVAKRETQSGGRREVSLSECSVLLSRISGSGAAQSQANVVRSRFCNFFDVRLHDL